jgi:hypothetical protein
MSEFFRPGQGEAAGEGGAPIYRPHVQFEPFGLVVSFDHALQAVPEEVNGAETVTSFVVDPSRELYLGLQLIPRPVLEEVARGLETYLEDEALEDEHKALITHGVSRLNRFFATGDLGNK